jgi:hypothetical protein
MVIAASIYLRFYIEVRVGVGTFLPSPTPPKIPSDSDSTALVTIRVLFMFSSVLTGRYILQMHVRFSVMYQNLCAFLCVE